MEVLIISTILSSLLLTITTSHNITQILDSDSSYSQFNNQLSQTGLADQINSRQTITVLVLSNPNMASILTHPEPTIKSLLSLLVVLDYLDENKLKTISNRTSLFTTLYQTSGLATQNQGFLNITDSTGGQVLFGSAVHGSNLNSNFVKLVKAFPYNISVVEISAPVIIPSMISAAPAPSSSVENITHLLIQSGCSNFCSLLSSTGVLTDYLSALASGLTIFAFTDKAFNGPRAADLRSLTGLDLATVMRFHAAPSYDPLGTLRAGKSIATMATRGTGKYILKSAASGGGGGVTLSTGFDSSNVVDTVLDSIPVSVFTVDGVLLPLELFGRNKSSEAPAPAPVKRGKKRGEAASVSPPAPATEAPGGAPAEGPSHEKVKSGGFVEEPKWAACCGGDWVAVGVGGDEAEKMVFSLKIWVYIYFHVRFFVSIIYLCSPAEDAIS